MNEKQYKLMINVAAEAWRWAIGSLNSPMYDETQKEMPAHAGDLIIQNVTVEDEILTKAKGRHVFDIDISDAHMDALRVIMSEEWPYADDRNLSPVFEAMIEEYLTRENGRLGSIIDGKYIVRSRNIKMTPINNDKEKGMDINEIREARAELEDKIQVFVAGLVNDFRDRTGISPSGIGIKLSEATIIGDREPRYVVAGVSVDLKL